MTRLPSLEDYDGFPEGHSRSWENYRKRRTADPINNAPVPLGGGVKYPDETWDEWRDRMRRAREFGGQP